jgi:hypothetical protein
MPDFNPEHQARMLLNLLRGKDSGIGESLCHEFRKLTPDQVAQTVSELKSRSDLVKVEYDAGEQVVGVTLSIDTGYSLYLVSPVSIPV